MQKTIMTVVLATAALVAAACDSPVAVIDLRVDHVTVGPTDRVLTVGDTMRLTAYPTTADGQILGSVGVTWQSDAPAVLEVASVDSSATAVVTAKAVGTVTVRAVSEGKTGLVTVTVVAAPLQPARLVIVQGGGSLRVGAQATLEAVLYSADSTVIGGRAVTWSSSNGPVLTVTGSNNSPFAVVHAHSTGSAVVTASSAGLQAVATFTVIPATTVARVEISAAATTMAIGAQQTIHATGYTADSTSVMGRPVQWSSSNPAVMTVAAFPGMTTALLAAMAPGTVTISATIDGVRRDVQFTVVTAPPAPAVAHVVFQPSRTGMWQQQNKVFQARTLQWNGLELTGRRVTYSVENEQVATVDSTGRVTAREVGSTRVVAESEGVRGYAELHVYALEQVMTFALTHDWYDGVPRFMEPMGTTTWTDSAGTEHEATLYAQTGTFTINRGTGAYTRVIQGVATALVNGTMQEVGRQTFTDAGAMYYQWDPYADGATEFDFVSATTPGLTYKGAFRSGGELMVRMPVLGNELRDVLYRIQR